METVVQRSLEKAHPWADWFTYERRNWGGAIIICALAGYAVGNGHTTSGAIDHISDQLGQTEHKAAIVQKDASCEHNRANKIASVAGQAILSNSVEAVPTPQFKDIPVDTCPHTK